MRIALIGSAPSSIRLAPFRDPSWSIWACSPGAYPIIASEHAFAPGDAFFELHRWEAPVIGVPHLQKPWFSPEYVQWLGQFKGTVWTGEPVADIPNSKRLPTEDLIGKYGPYFFTSSLAWMLAMAIEAGATEIGLWGVDMAATEEYYYQRPGCQFFILKALERGIKVIVPPESDLLQPMPLYGVGEWDPATVKATARLKELEGRLAGAMQNLEAAKQEAMFLQGAVDNHKYWINTYVGNAGIASLQVPKAHNAIPLVATESNVVSIASKSKKKKRG